MLAPPFLLCALPLLATPLAAGPLAAGPLAATSPRAIADPQEGAAEGLDDKSLGQAWEKARKSSKQKFERALEDELAALETHQLKLLRAVVEAADLNLKKIPERLEAPFYDPKVHTPKLPVKRRVIDPESSSARAFARSVFAKIPERGLVQAYAYDYGTREVVRVVEDASDPDLLFANALAGFAPQHDLAEALVEMQLDDGSQQRPAAAFGHAYSDRDGNGHARITIYDGWCSGREIEMPDVECLGIVHDVLDDWDTWQSPVPGSQQRQLYTRLEEIFADLRRFRGLRHALVRCYLDGNAVLRDDYESQLGTFQALWTTVDEDPASLAPILPDAAGWRDWLVDTAERIDEDEDDAWEDGQERIALLDADRAALRACLVRALYACKVLKE